jgi:hypothetical protein
MGDKAIVEQECAGPACSPRGKSAADRGKTEALVSTVAFGAGAVALAVTVILYVVDSAQGQGSRAHAGGLTTSVGSDGGALGWRF